MPMTDDELDQWIEWRDMMRKKHRVMSLGEYEAWCRGGDAISSPRSGGSFPGGLTIDLAAPPIIGRFRD